MTTVLVHRPARDKPVPGDPEPLLVAPPPQLKERQTGSMNAATMVMPLMSGSGSLLITLTNQHRPLFAAAGLLFLVASVGLGVVLFVGSRSSARRQQREQRERYLEHLEALRLEARSALERQGREDAARHPDPDTMLSLARHGGRVWERRARDPDFLALRVGRGGAELRGGVVLQGTNHDPLAPVDPVCRSAAEALVSRYNRLADQPIAIEMDEVGGLVLIGDRAVVRQLARAVIVQTAVLHAPEDVRIAIIRAPPLAASWEWAKWLPHNTICPNGDAAAPLIFDSFPEFTASIEEDLELRRAGAERSRVRSSRCRWFVVVDGEFQVAPVRLDTGAAESAAMLGVQVLHLVSSQRELPDQYGVSILLSRGGSAVVTGMGPSPVEVVPDGLDVDQAIAIARALAPLRLVEAEDIAQPGAAVDVRALWGVSDVGEVDTSRTWAPRTARDFLRVPIGTADGRPVHLDLKESAQGGMGPHGLLVGATGSGKSELLRALVCGLALGHPPQRLALLLVDFKGGATFAGMSALPHLAGSITNLAEEPGSVQRFRDALLGELTRRQRVLRDAGGLSDVVAYADARDRDPSMPPLPNLVVVIDEFSELLSARPDFADLFLAVGRIGRSIGVHLLLASQRVDAGRIRGLESHLSYRIGLRTFSEAESREVLGVPDAYHLPPEPGVGFLKVDTTVFERFRAVWMSAPAEPETSSAATPRTVRPFTSSRLLTPAELDLTAPRLSPPEPVQIGRPTLLECVLDGLAAVAVEPVTPVWLPPLPPALSLGAVFGDVGSGTAVRGVPLGIRDLPEQQRQEPLVWDFAGQQPHLLVLGAARAGKSVLISTLVAALAWQYAPGEVSVYCIDYGGGDLGGLADLPHVAGVCTRAEPERVRRALADVAARLEARERAPGREDGAGAVFLLIDGWTALREAEPDLEEQITAIVNRGAAQNVHVVITAAGSTQVRMRLASAMSGRIELRLSDPFDSGIDRTLAGTVPTDVPGRALVLGGELAQIALPRVDGVESAQGAAEGLAELGAAVNARWIGRSVRRLEVLPTHADLAELRRRTGPVGVLDGPAGRSGGAPVAIGWTERDLGPFEVDLFGADPHLQVYGQGQSGKSAALRALLRQVTARTRPADLAILLVDYRRAHLDLVPEEYLLSYCTSPAMTRHVVAQACSDLSARMPGADVPAARLRARDWWNGPELVVVVDDYDLVAGAGGNPLAGLIEYLPQGRDLGLHLVTARRTGGAARGMFEPLTQALNDLGGPGLLFSGERSEGRLVAGVASTILPPGRALLARRGQAGEQVQIAWSEPA